MNREWLVNIGGAIKRLIIALINRYFVDYTGLRILSFAMDSIAFISLTSSLCTVVKLTIFKKIDLLFTMFHIFIGTKLFCPKSIDKI